MALSSGKWPGLTFFTVILANIIAYSDGRLAIVGKSAVKLHFPPGFSHRSSHESFPTSFALETNVPNTSIVFTCQLLSSRLLPAIEIVGKPSSDLPHPGNLQACSYYGLATFSTLPDHQSKCVVSLCQGFQYGVVWLPLSDDSLQFEFDSDQFSTANFYNYNAKSLVENRLGQVRKQGRDNVQVVWAKQMLQNNNYYYPPGWLHVRIVVLVTVESFSSDFFKNDTKTTLDFLASSFGLINAIWSQFQVAIHLTRVIIWPYYNASSEVVPMPVEDWQCEVAMAARSAKISQDHLWPRLNTSADYIVVLRNVDRADTNASAVGYAPGDICTGTHEREPAFGATLYVSTEANETRAQVSMYFASLTAHELGHTFGIGHDDQNYTDCYCPTYPERRCVMHANVDRDNLDRFEWAWSTCSQDAFYMRRGRIPPLCLETFPDEARGSIEIVTTNKSTSPIGPTCGNGVVEPPDEECDCGPTPTQMGTDPPIDLTSNFCPNEDCCNRTTCKLAVGDVQCAYGPCCDVTTCSFLENGTLCRDQRNAHCDIAEFCNGTSAQCPDDRVLMTGTRCNLTDMGLPLDEPGGSCYQGTCFSREERCANLFGTLPVPTENWQFCYSFNMEGSNASNCGHAWFRPDNGTSFRSCDKKDMDCGNLMCSGSQHSVLNGRFLFAARSIYFGNDLVCSMVASPTLPDYGHVPDGMLCDGEQGYCLDHRCVKPLPKCPGLSPCDDQGVHRPEFLGTTTTSAITTTSSMIIESTIMTLNSTTGGTITSPNVTVPTSAFPVIGAAASIKNYKSLVSHTFLILTIITSLD